MLYVKTNISNNIEIKVDLYDDEIYTQCTKCGKEIQVDNETLALMFKYGDLASSSLTCYKCAEKNKAV